MSYEALASRLVRGRPLVLDADTLASFRARGVAMDTPGAVGELLRRGEAAGDLEAPPGLGAWLARLAGGGEGEGG